jgi:hypothetical protein
LYCTVSYCYPAGFWAAIAEHIQPSLTTEQVERLAFGFQVYLEKVSVVTCYFNSKSHWRLHNREQQQQHTHLLPLICGEIQHCNTKKYMLPGAVRLYVC